MRKFFKNKVLYILSATAIIFSCLFMFLFKGPQAKAESIEYDKITAQDIVANNSTKLYSGKYGTWSWTGVSGINTTAQMDMLGVTGYFEISTANDFKLVYTPNAATKSKIASMYVDIYWAGGDDYGNEYVPGGVNISNIFSANIERTGYWFYTDGDLTSPNTSKSNVIVTIKKPATGASIIWECYVRIGYNASAPVTISAGTGVKSVYLATTDNATTGSASGTEYDSGATVYGFAKLAKGYKHKSGWTKVSGTDDTEDAIYRVGSVTAGSGNFDTISADLITYYITYVLNGGTHGTTHPSSYNITTNTFTISDPTRTGYTFDGWSGTGFTGKVKKLSIAQGSIGDRTYTANWTADTYTIAFDKNAENATGTTNSVTATYDSTRSLTANGYSRVGYDFKGWATSSTGSVVYADGATLTAAQVNNLYATAKKNGTYTLYAKWAYVEEIQAVVNDINNIGTLEYTDTCKGKIETAEASYAGLSDIYKGVIEEYAEILESAREVYDNVDATVKAIDAIGDVVYTTDCKAKIDAAKALYDKLEDGEMAILPEAKKTVYTDAYNAYMAMDAINAIGTVVNTETCKKAIKDARAVYDAIPVTAKSLVLNYETLTNDEAVFAVIDKVNAIKYENTPECLIRIEDARTAYNALKPDQKDIFPAAELKTLEDSEAAFAVMQKIDLIGTIANTAESRKLVTDARTAYNGLTEDQEKLVLNYQKLLDAENSFKKVDNTDKLINDIGTLVYPDSETTISAAKAAYEELTPFEKGLVLNYETLTHKDKAYDVIKKINQIGSVTYPGSGDAIAKARAAYDALIPEEKNLVGYNNLAILATAEGYFSSLEDNAKSDEVIEKINAIAPLEISDLCKGKIDDARAAYNALTDDQKAIVDNYEDLTKAETDYAAAKKVVDLIKALGDVLATTECQEKITAARAAYGKLTPAQQALVYNYKDLTDREAAKPVVDAIALIDKVDGTTECQEKITAAREAYGKLTSEQQALVQNYKDLTDREAAKEVANLIQAIAPIVATKACKDKIDAARAAYGKLTPAQQALVANYDDLLAAEAVKPVVDKIAAIGTIDGSEACQGRIADARTAYNSLSKDEQALVSNKDDLLNAETVEPVVEKINAIGKVTYPTSKTAIETARAAYGKLTPAQQALVPAEILKALEDAEAEFKESDDDAKANAAIEKINAIGEVTYPGSKDKITAARAAYKDLTDDQKVLIPAETLKTLTDAEELFNKIDNVADLINKIGTVAYTEESKGKIDAARAAYNALSPEEQALVPATSLSALEAAEKQYQDLLDHAYADAATALINAIEKVKYPDSKGKIEAAREAYDALTDAQKAIVGFDNYTKLVQAEGNFDALKDLYYADIVKKLIKAIAPLAVSDECKARIDAARAAYDDEEFTDAQRQLVTNYADLVNAETNYAAAKKVVDLIDQLPDKLAESREAYGKLTPAQQALVYNYKDLLDAEASKVDTLINAIGTVAYTAECKGKIEAARKAYNELEDDAKYTVKNLEVLTTAETDYAALKTNAINDAKTKIAAIGTVAYTEESKGKIDAARKAYDAVLEADQTSVTNKQVLLDAEKAYDTLKANHDAAAAVDKLISEIGTLAYTAECKGKIDAAKEAYGKLTDAQKTLVTKLADLNAADALYSKIKNVDDKIDLIPSPLVIADETATAIQNARAAYNGLTIDEAKLVPALLADLENNENAYDVMKLIEAIKPFAYTDACKAKIDDARKAYDKLSDAAKALVANAGELTQAETDYNTNVDNERAKAVDDLIDAIGEFAYTAECKTNIDAAKKAYGELTPTQMEKVTATKKQALDTAVNRYQAITDAISAINNIGTVAFTAECKGKIDAAKAAIEKTGEDVSFIQVATMKAYNDKSAAYSAMEKIAVIGNLEFTEACLNRINEANTAYGALNDDAKAMVTNKTTLDTALAFVAKINAVIATIDAIPSPLVVNDETAKAINDARAAYNALSKDEQSLFPADKLEVLVNNEVAYEIMQAIAGIPSTIDVDKQTTIDAIVDARAAYDAEDVTDAQKALVANYQTLLDAEVALTIGRIAKIDTVAYTEATKTKIDAARQAFNALTEAQKTSVTNYEKLTQAEKAFDTAKATAVADAIAKINAIGTVAYTKECYEAIYAAVKAYTLVLPEDVEEITNAEAFIDALKKYVELRDATVNDVITKINAIGTVEYTKACYEAIDAAREAYNALVGEDKPYVTNLDTLTNAESNFATARTQAITDAISAINNIGTVAYTDTCKAKIDAARTSYNTILDADQAEITNKQTLLDAEAAYEALKADHDAAAAVDALIDAILEVEYTTECEKQITDARDAYGKLTPAQKALVEDLDLLEDAEDEYARLKADHEAADAVDALIELIPDPVVYNAECEKAITDARTAYDKLTDAQQDLVDYLPELEDAEAAYNALKADHEAADDAIAKINAIGTVTYTEATKTKIDAARLAYDALTADQKALVSAETLKTLTDAEDLYAKLEADNTKAQAVVEKINAIGTITYTPESKALIEAARTSYNALTADQKALVSADTLKKLTDAEAAYTKLEADNNAAAAVDAKINAIGTVTYTPESKALIDAARAAYNALTADQKALVKDVNTLTNAEAAYTKLETDNTKAQAVVEKINAIGDVQYNDQTKAKIDAARAAYNALTEDQKALVNNTNTLTNAEDLYATKKTNADAAKAVEAKINAIGKVQYNAQTKAKIDEAKKAYNALTAEQKALVTNNQTLTKAETTYDEVEAVYTKINAIGTVEYTDSSKEDIDRAREAYNSLSDEEKALVTNAKTLTQAEAQYTKLENENKTSTTWTIGLSVVGGVILLGAVVVLVIYRKKEGKAEA